MPRPPDTYTHGQFMTVESDNKGETVQCKHCKNWTGNIKTLNRKKEHLLKCPQYLQWRSQGHGEELAPPNSYQKRDSDQMNADMYSSPYAGAYPDPSPAGPSTTPALVKSRSYDISKAFDEFWDDNASQKCMRVRCKHCGFVRAKNTTRQVEHLSNCQDFLNSSEGQQALSNGSLQIKAPNNGNDIWRGSAPNPNLQGLINRRGPQKHPRLSFGNPHSLMRPASIRPSLASHLVNKFGQRLNEATQNSFLSHSGCGSLSSAALNQWLAQEIYLSRALIPFVGALIGKVKIPETPNLQTDSTFRAVDLLVSACSNMKKELEFLESTKIKFNLRVEPEEPTPAVRGFCDLFMSASSTSSSLLEGLVLLWATEHFFCVSFQYANTFVQPPNPAASSSYSVPSFFTPGQSNKPYPTSGHPGEEGHIAALHEALIHNWTSPNFVRFVSACRSIVDEVANASVSGNGRAEMEACERLFSQAIWLWNQIWPQVNGMGEKADDVAVNAGNSSAGAQQSRNSINGNGKSAMEVDDEAEADPTVDSPYGGTGLEAIAAHNQETVNAEHRGEAAG
ncbi:hypothetical protein K470DRAFT_258877 [Piedraia hortae CBS 480.64]|uniref:Heme oxygenase-like protein n=1 Tax=Piedraia hortae CBS 480.64 TaxID=1314780 RepID=A0A6A7BWF5_9PEZI|nr:hypothetical protein K470DRAFT_258877 [Piedraia hortae CBS 480.64]